MFTEFITNPKNNIFINGYSWDFLKCITKPKFCNRKINTSFDSEISLNVSDITGM